MRSIVREYSQGAIIFNEGDIGNAAYILTEGSVEICLGSGEKRSVLSVVTPVSVFGEMALLLKEQKRTATAIAKSSAKVAEIVRKDFEEFIEQSPKLVSAVLSALVERLQKTTSMVTKVPDPFIAIGETLHLLLVHTTKMIKYDTKATMIKYDLFVKSVSAALLYDISTVTKTLSNMETLGLIEIKVDENDKLIDVVRKQDFLERVRKISETFSLLGVK